MKVRLIIKRIIDILVSVSLLIILFPLFITLSLLIKYTSAGPIFFIQERLGYQGRPFHIIKFRTMVQHAELIGDGIHINDISDNRITPVGRILRASSLDELPQLLNVLKGDMSLVGPRPPLPSFPYNGYQNYPLWAQPRFDMKPGITGLAQVKVRNSVPWDDRMRYDTQYIHDFSLIQDFSILFQTFIKVIRQVGIYE